MKHGNVTVRGWFCVCVLLLAILPTLSAVQQWYAVYSVPVTDPRGAPYNGTVTVTFGGDWTVSGGVATHTEVYVSSQAGGWSYPITVFANGGAVLVPVGGPGLTWQTAISWPTIIQGLTVNYTWHPEVLGTVYARTGDQRPVNYTEHVSIALVNNKNTAQTVLCKVGGTTVQTATIPALGSQTVAFDAVGVTGTSIDVQPSPDSIVWESNYDPMAIQQGGGTLTRAGHFGTAPHVVHVRCIVMSFATSAVNLAAVLDGATIGSVASAAAVAGSGSPAVVTYNYDVQLSDSSALSFTAATGHTVAVQQTIAANTWTYVLTVDAASQTAGNVTSVSPPDSGGGVTATTTNTTTGTTTIARTGGGTASNTNTSPGGAFVGVGVVGGGYVITNTSGGADSAASQDSANSLAAIERHTNDSAQVATTAANDTQTGTAAGKVTLADLQGRAASAVAAGQSAANQGAVAAGNAYAAFGSMPAAVAEPSAASDGAIDLNIGGGQTKRLQLNPFSPNGPFGGVMQTAAAFVRRLIAWGIVATFFVWCMGKVREMTAKPFATAPFGNSLAESINSIKFAGFGGGLGYAVKLAVYALILTVVLTLPLVVMAAVTSGLPWSSLVSTWHAGPHDATAPGILSDALALANIVVPWSMLMAAPVWYFMVEFILFPSQFFWMMFIKFLPV